MGDNELAALEARLRSIDAKLERIETRMESFATASARHSERLKSLDSDVRIAHGRIGEMKSQLAGGARKIIGILLGVCGVTLGIIWNWIKTEIGK
jgi:chromosome segregation ATPase